ncbi:serine/threonine protein kinase [Nesterenkonia alba]|uniref:serine/threonine protein kinase n=1 Tax=Nesterenkonia alba TaxID=515814 RepID=UPI000424E5E1|nr:serine/threonine-protein kinase [Nesterenkonia alba]
MGDIFAGRYELVDPLGEGGAGVVWRVWDHKHRRYSAAKVLRQVDASSLLRFMREQSMRLDHPHVLAPTGWAGEDDKVLFTMPIVRGGSVATLVGDFGPLPPRLAAVLLDQLLIALEAIHTQGIVHRDVKPANLLLDATGRGHPHLWLGDFGIAAGDDAPRLTQGPFAMGTPGYVAPECLHHGWQPDVRADLYSAGRCAVEMLLGTTPEAEDTARQALAFAELPQPLPEDFVAMVARLEHPAITERYQSATQARDALRRTGLLEPAPTEHILGEIEVFDQIPPLPEGWGEHGPEGDTPAPQGPYPATGAGVPVEPEPAPVETTTGQPEADRAGSRDTPAPTRRVEPAEHHRVESTQPAQTQGQPPRGIHHGSPQQVQAGTQASARHPGRGAPSGQVPVPQLGLRDANTVPGPTYRPPETPEQQGNLTQHQGGPDQQFSPPQGPYAGSPAGSPDTGPNRAGPAARAGYAPGQHNHSGYPHAPYGGSDSGQLPASGGRSGIGLAIALLGTGLGLVVLTIILWMIFA